MQRILLFIFVVQLNFMQEVSTLHYIIVMLIWLRNDNNVAALH